MFRDVNTEGVRKRAAEEDCAVANRIDVSLANLDIDRMLQFITSWDELDIDCKKRKAESAAASAQPARRRGRKQKKGPKEPWG
jgi:hypothetical protein